MEELTLNQLRLLLLCSRETGPCVGEFEEFGASYGINRETVRGDYIVLLSQKLVRPLCSIAYADFYLPTHCLITEHGKEVLRDARRDTPELDSPHFFSYLTDDRTKNECFEILTRDWPTVEKMCSEDVAELADVYLFWAQENEAETTIPNRELFNAAARGFGRIADLRRFVKALRGYFATETEDGHYLNLAMTGGQMLKEFPAFAEATVACLASALKEPFHDLTGKEIPSLSKDNYLEFLQEFFREAVEIGKAYNWKKPNENPLIGISNRIEDILGKAFETSNQNLFLQTIHLQYLYVQLMESMVCVPDSVSAFEERVGYKRCVALAQRVCWGLETYAHLVELPEIHRKVAYQTALEIVRVVQRLAAVPLWNRLSHPDSEENQAGLWTFDLLGYPERRAFARLSLQFEQLERLRMELKSKDNAPSAIQQLFDTDYLQNELSEVKATLARIDENSAYVRYIKLAEISEPLHLLLTLAMANTAILPQLCSFVAHSNLVIHTIDLKLNDSLAEIRSDVREWIEFVKTSEELAKEQRNKFMAQLSEICKLESAGQIIASIPLIPGFLEYKTTVGTKIDLNKWLSKLASSFKR